jgi:hypothetical protein
MLSNIQNALLALVLLVAGGVFFVSYGYGLKSIFTAFGPAAFIVSCVAHVIVWIGIASLFDKRHPPPR